MLRESLPARIWPLITALGIFAVALTTVTSRSIRANDGHLVYCIDDAYIHMAEAKHLAQNGVFGVTPYQFSSSSSSHLWVLLLAAIYWLTGPSEIAPFVVNILGAIGCLVLIYVLGRRWLSSGAIFLLLIGVIFLMPMVPLVLSGMEHILHICIALGMSWLAAGMLSHPEGRSSFRHDAMLCVLGIILVAIRYEGLFQVAVIAALFCCAAGPASR